MARNPQLQCSYCEGEGSRELRKGSLQREAVVLEDEKEAKSVTEPGA
jgi:hypothetical protein